MTQRALVLLALFLMAQSARGQGTPYGIEVFSKFEPQPELQPQNQPAAAIPQNTAAEQGTLLEQVLARSGKPDYFRSKYASDPATCCHEATHAVNNVLSLKHGFGGWCNIFYVGGGKAYSLPTPNVTITTVSNYVPAQHRNGVYWDLYFVRPPKEGNNDPLYILDEWSASINGWQASRELGCPDTGDSQMSRTFITYADAVVAAVRQNDPQYKSMTQLVAFVEFQKRRCAKLVNPSADPTIGATAQCGPGGCNYGPSYGGGYYIQQPQYRPQPRPQVPRPQQPPVQPPQSPPSVVTQPEPEIDPEALEQMKAEATAAAVAAAKAEVSVMVKNEIIQQGGVCGCGPKWEKWDQVKIDLDNRITNIDARVTKIENTKLDYDKIAEEMQKRLTHSANITLLDGTVQPQTHPLNNPLEFGQRARKP